MLESDLKEEKYGFESNKEGGKAIPGYIILLITTIGSTVCSLCSSPVGILY